MATTGAKLTVPHTVSGSAIVGQGNSPELWVLYSTDDASVSTPVWNDATAKVRAFSTSRGRENELAEVDAGTAGVTLDNRTRTFDPVINTAIRPMNRWLLREQFSGETQDIFKGYADSYQQRWPGGMDAETAVQLTDEFKRLALDRLPVTNPPRDSYADVVQFDQPSGYWQFNNPVTTGLGSVLLEATATAGQTLTSNASLLTVESPIRGDSGYAVSMSGSQQLTTGALTEGASGDAAGLAEFSVEVWVKASDVTPASTETLIRGPLSSSNAQWRVDLNTGGTISVVFRNSGGTDHTVTSATLADATWYHIVGVIRSGNVFLYVNGSQMATTAWSGSFGTMDADSEMVVLDGSVPGIYYFDELALYRYGLTAGRVDAHYIAGTERGFAAQLSGLRIHALLDEGGSSIPRQIDAGLRDVTPRYMNGQDPLGEIRVADRADDPDSVYFTARDGTQMFLDGDHRSSSPYDTVQATFDDDGTDLPYQDVDVDYSESFLTNEYNGTRIGGGLLTASDATSIARYGKRPQTVTDLPVTDDADVQAVIDAMLAKYREPMTRITSLTLTTQVPDVAEAIFRRDIGDRIRVFRTPPGGGARIDQTLFIQKITVEGANDGAPWQITWGVSPL